MYHAVGCHWSICAERDQRDEPLSEIAFDIHGLKTIEASDRRVGLTGPEAPQTPSDVDGGIRSLLDDWICNIDLQA